MADTQPLRLGMFVMPIHDPTKPLTQCLDEDLELAVKCEELGFDDFWVGEHHSSSVENIVMPEIFLAKQWKTYANAAAVAGRIAHPSDWAVSRNVFVADSTDEARRLVRANSLGSCIQYILDLTQATARNGISMWKRDSRQSDTDCNLDYFLDEIILAGDPEHVVSELVKLRERIGVFGSLVLVAHDWDNRQRWLRSLELLATEVVARFNSAIAAA